MQSRQRFHFVFLSSAAMNPPTGGSSNLCAADSKSTKLNDWAFEKTEV
jgi:hypothetical protein